MGYSTDGRNGMFNRIADYGACFSCDAGVGVGVRDTVFYCLPKFINSVRNVYVDYLVFQDFLLCDMPYLLVSTPSPTYSFIYSLPPSYKSKLTFLLILTNTTLTPSTLSITKTLNLPHNLLS